MLHLAGVTVEAGLDGTGLAAAWRVFLAAAPLLRSGHQLESTSTHLEVFEPLWPGDASGADELPDEDPNLGQTDEAGTGERDQLLTLVRELAGFAGIEARPALLDLFLELRRHTTARRLPPSYARLALPLSLHQAGLVPEAAPGLLGGRLPLKATGLSGEPEPLTPWLARGLSELTRETEVACRRL